MPLFRDTLPSTPRARSEPRDSDSTPDSAIQQPKADGLVVFARGAAVPSVSSAIEARLAVRCARHARVLYVPGLESADGSNRSGLGRRVRGAFGAIERDDSGALIARPLILPTPWPRAAELAGVLLAKQLEGFLAQARIAFPAALCAHPLAGLALGRESWRSVFRLDSAAPKLNSGVVGGGRDLGWAHAAHELDRRAIALASEPPPVGVRARAFARGLDRPRYALLDALDQPDIDVERLLRVLERLDQGVLLVRGPAPKGLIARLRERSRIPLVEPEETLDPLELCEVAIAVRQEHAPSAAERIDTVLALGLPLIATRVDHSPELEGLGWFSDDPHDLAAKARAFAQERDDELPARRRSMANDRRLLRLEASLLAVLLEHSDTP